MCKKKQTFYLIICGTANKELKYGKIISHLSVILQKKLKLSELIQNASLAKENIYFVMTHWLLHKYCSKASTLAKPFILTQYNTSIITKKCNQHIVITRTICEKAVWVFFVGEYNESFSLLYSLLLYWDVMKNHYKIQWYYPSRH